ncbi:MAG: transposase [Actinomycetota bacterium]
MTSKTRCSLQSSFTGSVTIFKTLIVRQRSDSSVAIVRWVAQISAWHRACVSSGPTEDANNLVKRVKRVAFGFASFENCRIRSLLYAGKPDWTRLATITPH